MNNTSLKSGNNAMEKLAKADTASFVLKSSAAVWYTDGCQEFVN